MFLQPTGNLGFKILICIFLNVYFTTVMKTFKFTFCRHYNQTNLYRCALLPDLNTGLYGNLSFPAHLILEFLKFMPVKLSRELNCESIKNIISKRNKPSLSLNLL
jgi:hypothetical protein